MPATALLLECKSCHRWHLCLYIWISVDVRWCAVFRQTDGRVHWACPNLPLHSAHL